MVVGPALIIDATQTLFVEPNFEAYILTDHVEIKNVDHTTFAHEEEEEYWSLIQLSVFAHRFMSVVERMGNTLQRTFISTRIRKRLDFSCAILSLEGQLAVYSDGQSSAVLSPIVKLIHQWHVCKMRHSPKLTMLTST